MQGVVLAQQDGRRLDDVANEQVEETLESLGQPETESQSTYRLASHSETNFVGHGESFVIDNTNKIDFDDIQQYTRVGEYYLYCNMTRLYFKKFSDSFYYQCWTNHITAATDLSANLKNVSVLHLYSGESSRQAQSYNCNRITPNYSV